jgi:hypothetical protein
VDARSRSSRRRELTDSGRGRVEGLYKSRTVGHPDGNARCHMTAPAQVLPCGGAAGVLCSRRAGRRPRPRSGRTRPITVQEDTQGDAPLGSVPRCVGACEENGRDRVHEAPLAYIRQAR